MITGSRRSAARSLQVRRIHVHGRFSNGINQYKHGISWRYLFLGDEGTADERAVDGSFRRIAIREAIGRVEAPLRQIGETLYTPYDAEYIRRKDAALRAAGFEVDAVQVETGA